MFTASLAFTVGMSYAEVADSRPTVCVTGATGFVASVLIDELKTQGYTVPMTQFVLGV
jgi:hypothetical protein